MCVFPKKIKLLTEAPIFPLLGQPSSAKNAIYFYQNNKNKSFEYSKMKDYFVKFFKGTL